VNENIYRLKRTVCGLGLALTCALVTGCSGSLFKVKPAVDLPALPATARSANAGGLAVRVGQRLSDEESQELFEANLPLNGVLAVRMELTYETGGVPLELKRARFHLRDANSREWKLLTPKQAIARILKANDISLYNPSARKEFEKDFGAYAIDLKSPLNAAEHRRQGFVFFQTPDKGPVRSPAGLVLSATGLSQSLEIKLD
jgi:hypothetical protein